MTNCVFCSGSGVVDVLTKNDIKIQKCTECCVLEQQEVLISDLKYQLTFEDIDWSYFIATAKRAEELQKTQGKFLNL